MQQESLRDVFDLVAVRVLCRSGYGIQVVEEVVRHVADDELVDAARVEVAGAIAGARGAHHLYLQERARREITGSDYERREGNGAAERERNGRGEDAYVNGGGEGERR